jgi:hypothetical protein
LTGHCVAFREIVKPLMTGFSDSLQKAFKTLEDVETYMEENQVTKYTKFSDKEHVEVTG